MINISKRKQHPTRSTETQDVEIEIQEGEISYKPTITIRDRTKSKRIRTTVKPPVPPSTIRQSVRIYQGLRDTSDEERGAKSGAFDTSTHPLSAGDDIIRRKGVTTAVINYGRFQPPTIGHRVLIQDIYKYAIADDVRTKKDAYIFVTRSCNEPDKYHATGVYKAIVSTQQFESCRQNENPLTAYQRTFYMKTMFAKEAPAMRFINCVEKAIDSPITAINELKRAGYERVIFKCGSDRVKDFKFLERAFPDLVQVEQAGDIRDEEGIIDKNIQPHQMSGTKMRLAAVEGKIVSFKRGLMIAKDDGSMDLVGYMTEDLAIQLMNDIRDGLQTNLKPLRKEEFVQLGGTKHIVNRKRAFNSFVKRWLARKEKL